MYSYLDSSFIMDFIIHFMKRISPYSVSDFDRELINPLLSFKPSKLTNISQRGTYFKNLVLASYTGNFPDYVKITYPFTESSHHLLFKTKTK